MLIIFDQHLELTMLCMSALQFLCFIPLNGIAFFKSVGKCIIFELGMQGFFENIFSQNLNNNSVPILLQLLLRPFTLYIDITFRSVRLPCHAISIYSQCDGNGSIFYINFE